jgi:hypothetical protein
MIRVAQNLVSISKISHIFGYLGYVVGTRKLGKLKKANNNA